MIRIGLPNFIKFMIIYYNSFIQTYKSAPEIMVYKGFP